MGDSYKDRLAIEFVTVTGGQVDNAPDGPQSDTKQEYILNVESATSPPAYLHLALNSLTETSPRQDGIWAIHKTWVVDTIKDLNGAIVTNDPDWVCYSDNEYDFRKNSTVLYRPGTNICPADQLLDDKGLSEVWINYTIRSEFRDFDNPGKISMEFKVPEPAKEFIDDFSVEIMYSDFNRAVFRISKDTGEQADLILSPQL